MRPAEERGANIVNADSMQVYRNRDPDGVALPCGGDARSPPALWDEAASEAIPSPDWPWISFPRWSPRRGTAAGRS